MFWPWIFSHLLFSFLVFDVSFAELLNYESAHFFLEALLSTSHFSTTQSFFAPQALDFIQHIGPPSFHHTSSLWAFAYFKCSLAFWRKQPPFPASPLITFEICAALSSSLPFLFPLTYIPDSPKHILVLWCLGLILFLVGGTLGALGVEVQWLSILLTLLPFLSCQCVLSW